MNKKIKKHKEENDYKEEGILFRIFAIPVLLIIGFFWILGFRQCTFCNYIGYMSKDKTERKEDWRICPICKTSQCVAFDA